MIRNPGVTVEALTRDLRARQAERAATLTHTWPALWYGQVALVTWTFYELLVRLSDLFVGFSNTNPLTLVPLLAMLPFTASACYGMFRGVPKRLQMLGWTWAGTLAIGFSVAAVTHNLTSGVFDLFDFGLPPFFAFWLVRKRLDADAMIARFGGTIIWVAAITSLYGMRQYIAPPPWDALWMLNGGANGIGIPAPYQVRVFSTLTAPSTYAAFLVCTLVITIGRWHVRPLLNTIPLVLNAVALALTLERSCWIALSIGLATYLAFTARRGRALLGVSVGVGILAVVISSAAVSSPHVQESIFGLQQRLNSLQDTSQDYSTQDREQQSRAAIRVALEHPFGFGLGLYGVAAKLHSLDSELPGWIDNGYLARFIELGWIGFVGYLCVTFGAFFLTVARWRECRRDSITQSALAISLGVQAVLLVLDASQDHHAAYVGVIFWFVVAVSVAAPGAGDGAAQNGSGSRSQLGRLAYRGQPV